MNLNTRLFYDVNGFARDTLWLHGIAAAYINLAVAALALLVIAGYFLARARRPESMALSLWVGIGTLVAIAVNQPLVHLFNEPRPFVTLPHVLLVVPHKADPGLPSDHAVLAGAVIAGLLLLDRRLGVIATVVGVLLAADRVYIGVHYPGDVAAGLAVGAVVVVLGWLLLHVLLVMLVDRLRLSRLRPLVAAR